MTDGIGFPTRGSWIPDPTAQGVGESKRRHHDLLLRDSAVARPSLVKTKHRPSTSGRHKANDGYGASAANPNGERTKENRATRGPHRWSFSKSIWSPTK